MSADRPYRPHLDSLRALAVATVLYTHFVDDESYVGTIGVRLFFVLSGFLITEIVLRHGRDLNTWKEKRRFLLRFYARRAIRLMPAYYLAILLALVLYGSKMREVVLWYIFYVPNILFAVHGEWVPMYTAHFWTLGVEEQFYLVWPLLLLVTSAIPAIWICGAAIGLFVFYGYSAVEWGMTSFAFNMVPLAQLDALAAGGLLAAYRVRVDRFPAVCVPLGWASLAAVATLYANGGTDPWWIAQSLSVLPAAALVAAADDGFKGLPGRLSSLPPVLAIGRLSYGIYVYHLPMRTVLGGLEARTGLHIEHDVLRVVALVVMSVGAAWISWRFMESRVNRLKRYLPYDGTSIVQRPIAAQVGRAGE